MMNGEFEVSFGDELDDEKDGSFRPIEAPFRQAFLDAVVPHCETLFQAGFDDALFFSDLTFKLIFQHGSDCESYLHAETFQWMEDVKETWEENRIEDHKKWIEVCMPVFKQLFEEYKDQYSDDCAENIIDLAQQPETQTPEDPVSLIESVEQLHLEEKKEE